MKRPQALLIPLFLLLSHPGGINALELQIQGQTLIATGSEGSVAFFGVSREVAFDDVVTRSRTLEVVPLLSRTGVELDLGKPPVPDSVWVAVDLFTGEFATAAPNGPPVQSDTFQGAGVGRGAGGNGTISDLRAQGEVLVARPGAGAWTLTLGDGSPEDGDGLVDGQIQAPLDQMAGLPDNPPPPLDFIAGDTVVLIDPLSLEIVVTRIPGGA
ncbi:MAG TPA: hypothetical protein VN851_07840 [Thermoanaerobaculia bacterium]|nr:hypothetical protein [Thermoanaerobaculia bacterium]